MSVFPKRIVYVDDEQSIRQVVREAMTRVYPNLVMVTCGSGTELLSRLRELQPELILLDLMMPGMSGPDVVAALRKKEDGADIPVIFVTGKAKVEMTAGYKNLGVIGVIHKPFEVLTLAESIGTLWRQFKNFKTPAQ